ncbi:hypothetical protein L2E82_12987 [Cichorium intybus]|uniref:Uncharacterized protein n=1 Tax=Cichorium intybus TaxID=13427 RepID=A0ACB9GIP5_CICIN|nr:hypothetical protein L2E82_12987 [Cichorium intybus]
MFHKCESVAFGTGLIASGAVVMVLSKFKIHEMFSAIGLYKIIYLPLSTAPIKLRKKYDLRSLKWVISGCAPLSKEFDRRVHGKLPWSYDNATGIGASTYTLEESQRKDSSTAIMLYTCWSLRLPPHILYTSISLHL